MWHRQKEFYMDSGRVFHYSQKSIFKIWAMTIVERVNINFGNLELPSRLD